MDTKTQTDASATRRYLARTLDVVASLNVLVPLAVAATVVNGDGTATYLAVSLTVSALHILSLVAQQTFFGNSLGKYILGVKAYPLGGRERGLAFFANREARVFALGQAFGFTLPMAVANGVNYWMLTRQGSTLYDREFSRVVRYADPGLRLLLVVPLLAPLVAVIVFAAIFVAARSGAPL